MQTERLSEHMEKVHQTAQKAASDLHSRPWFPTSTFGSAPDSSNTSNAEWASGAAFSSPLARSSIVYKAERPLQSPEAARRGAAPASVQPQSGNPKGTRGSTHTHPDTPTDRSLAPSQAASRVSSPTTNQEVLHRDRRSGAPPPPPARRPRHGNSAATASSTGYTMAGARGGMRDVRGRERP